jgi:hypothetical protein
MIIGRSRIGVGRIGIATASGGLLEALASISILGTNSPYVNVSLNIIDVDIISTSVGLDIIPYGQRLLPTSISILGRIPIPISASLNISGRMYKSTPTAISIVAVRYHSVKAALSIIGNKYISVRAGISVLGNETTFSTIGLNIAELMELPLLACMSISGYEDIYTNTNINISDHRASSAKVGLDMIDVHYWAIGPEGGVLDLSGKVADPKPDGFGIEASKTGMLEGRRVNLRDKGIKGGEYTFYVYLNNDSDRQAFQKVVNNDAKDYVLHIGRSDRFYYIKKMATNPEKIKVARGPVQRVTCWMEDPCLYHTWDQGLALGICALPQDSTYKFNYGTTPTPILFKIGGVYSGGQLTHPHVKTWNATEERDLYIGPGLLSNEQVELTLDGWLKRYLRHTYSDDYSSNNYWQYDAVQIGCSLVGGQVSIPAGKWFYYIFQGHPLKDDIELEATITKTGSPIIQYSTDGSTWQTAITADEIVNGTKKYYLTGTEKLQTVYVRFYSPAGSSMTIQDVSFTFDRDISSQYDQMPLCPAQESRKIRVEGSGSARARLQTTFRSRWHAQ